MKVAWETKTTYKATQGMKTDIQNCFQWVATLAPHLTGQKAFYVIKSGVH